MKNLLFVEIQGVAQGHSAENLSCNLNYLATKTSIFFFFAILYHICVYIYTFYFIFINTMEDIVFHSMGDI